MHNTASAFRYQLSYFAKFTVILLLTVFFNLLLITLILAFVRAQNSGADVIAGQIDAQTYFMIFILGLLSFVANYKFMLANGFSRRLFFRANLAALALIAAAWTGIVMILAAVCKLIAPFKLIPELVYKGLDPVGEACWLLAALFMMASLGWCIGLIYNRCGLRGKIIVSISPFAVLTVAAVIDYRIGGMISKGLGRFFLAVLGISGGASGSYLGAGSMLFFALVLCGCSFLLMRRAQIKE